VIAERNGHRRSTRRALAQLEQLALTAPVIHLTEQREARPARGAILASARAALHHRGENGCRVRAIKPLRSRRGARLCAPLRPGAGQAYANTTACAGVGARARRTHRAILRAMSPPDDAYRDALAAAHERIAQLEILTAASRQTHAKAATLAALRRERARVADGVVPHDDWQPMVAKRILLPLGVLSLVFVFQGDWVFSSLGVFFGVGTWFGVGAFVRSSATASARQLALVDAEIATIEREMAAAVEPSHMSAGDPPR
jgi:hypothetical protein